MREIRGRVRLVIGWSLFRGKVENNLINTEIGKKDVSYDGEFFYVDEEKYIKIEEIVWEYE